MNEFSWSSVATVYFSEWLNSSVFGIRSVVETYSAQMYLALWDPLNVDMTSMDLLIIFMLLCFYEPCALIVVLTSLVMAIPGAT